MLGWQLNINLKVTAGQQNKTRNTEAGLTLHISKALNTLLPSFRNEKSGYESIKTTCSYIMICYRGKCDSMLDQPVCRLTACRRDLYKMSFFPVAVSSIFRRMKNPPSLRMRVLKKKKFYQVLSTLNFLHWSSSSYFELSALTHISSVNAIFSIVQHYIPIIKIKVIKEWECAMIWILILLTLWFLLIY